MTDTLFRSACAKSSVDEVAGVNMMTDTTPISEDPES
jgi:hypothetical protein